MDCFIYQHLDPHSLSRCFHSDCRFWLQIVYSSHGIEASIKPSLEWMLWTQQSSRLMFEKNPIHVKKKKEKLVRLWGERYSIGGHQCPKSKGYLLFSMLYGWCSSFVQYITTCTLLRKYVVRMLHQLDAQMYGRLRVLVLVQKSNVKKNNQEFWWQKPLELWTPNPKKWILIRFAKIQMEVHLAIHSQN